MKDKSRKVFGFILIFIGILLVGKTFGLIFFDLGDFFRALLPMGIILIGVWLMVRRKKMDDSLKDKSSVFDKNINVSVQTFDSKSASSFNVNVDDFTKAQSEKTDSFSHAEPDNKSTQSPKTDTSGKSKYEKLFGDIFIDLNNINVKNVEVSMFVGDVEIKIHGAKLVDGLNRIIISSFIGSIRIFTPKDMAVFLHNSNFIGDIDAFGKRSSGFGNNLEAQTQNYDSSSKKLYIACNSFIGDIRIIEI